MKNDNVLEIYSINKSGKKRTGFRNYFSELFNPNKVGVCNIEFYNYSKFENKDPFYTLLNVNRNGKTLPKEIKNNLRVLERFEYPNYIYEKLKQKFPFNKLSDQEIKECIIEFKKFVALIIINRSLSRSDSNVKDNQIIISMTNNIIDEIWHNFILFTKEYHEFSKNVFGKYFHHTPNSKKVRMSENSMLKFYQEYKKYFGSLHPIWYYEIKNVENDAVQNDSYNLKSKNSGIKLNLFKNILYNFDSIEHSTLVFQLSKFNANMTLSLSKSSIKFMEEDGDFDYMIKIDKNFPKDHTTHILNSTSCCKYNHSSLKKNKNSKEITI